MFPRYCFTILVVPHKTQDFQTDLRLFYISVKSVVTSLENYAEDVWNSVQLRWLKCFA